VTSKQPDPASEIPKVKLQQMDFRLQTEDDNKVVYRAEVQDDKAPGKPVWAMTVTAARPQDREEKEALERFMREMAVGFVLTPPHPEQDTDDEPVPGLDLADEMLIEHQLVRTAAPDGTSGATVVVSTIAGPGAREAQLLAPAARAAAKLDRVSAKSHRWAAKGGVSTTATATARRGSGRIRSQKATNPNTFFTVGPNPGRRTGKTVWVVGIGGTCEYLFTGNFNGPYTN